MALPTILHSDTKTTSEVDVVVEQMSFLEPSFLDVVHLWQQVKFPLQDFVIALADRYDLKVPLLVTFVA